MPRLELTCDCIRRVIEFFDCPLDALQGSWAHFFISSIDDVRHSAYRNTSITRYIFQSCQVTTSISISSLSNTDSTRRSVRFIAEPDRIADTRPEKTTYRLIPYRHLTLRHSFVYTLHMQYGFVLLSTVTIKPLTEVTSVWNQKKSQRSADNFHGSCDVCSRSLCERTKL